MPESEKYINIRFRPKDSSYHAYYVFGNERLGMGYFGSDLDECRVHILSASEGDSGVDLRSIGDRDDPLERMEPLSKEDLELLVMLLNEEDERFKVGKTESLEK